MESAAKEPPVKVLISPKNWFWAKNSLNWEASTAGIGIFEINLKITKIPSINRTRFLKSGRLKI